MFGIIYTLASLVGFGVSGTHAAIENAQAKQRGYERKARGENPSNTYYDRKGAMRDLETGEFADLERDRLTGDTWVRIGAPSKRHRNLSAEWRKNFYEEKKANPEPGRTVVNDIEIPYHSHPDMMSLDSRWHNYYYCAGQWYKDLNTGRLYVIRSTRLDDRRYISGEFYMDVLTRRLIRPSDGFIEDLKNRGEDMAPITDDDIRQMMNEWNRKVEKEYNVKPTDVYEWREYYFNDAIGHDSRAFEEIKMMGNARPIRYR